MGKRSEKKGTGSPRTRAGIVLSLVLVAFVAWMSGCARLEGSEEVPLSERVGSFLRTRIETERAKRTFVCRKEVVCGIGVIPSFYGERDFRPSWIGTGGEFPQADSLIGAIRDSAGEGLNPDDYHLAAIRALRSEARRRRAENRPPDPEALADLDLLLTDAFLLFGSHLMAGRVNPETIHTDWILHRPRADLAATLRSALESNRVAEVLNDLRPPHPGYAGLERALARYRELARLGGWPAVPPGPRLRKGDRGERVRRLVERLSASGDLALPAADNGTLFDDRLETAVQTFQRRHGLEADGIVGPGALAALNVPVEERVRQIELNLERWRWIPHDLGEVHLLANIAGFDLRAVDRGAPGMNMRIVAGKPAWRTPVFSAKLTYLEVNPYWNVPQRIAARELLPAVRRRPAFFAEQGIKVFESWREGAREIDPDTVDWSKIGGRSLAYKFRQEPGPRNPLGRVKFMFPNRFSVYLHDTPARGLFRSASRGFSHGCVRVEKPVDLAEYLLKDDPRWTRDKIVEAIDGGKRTIIPLRKPVTVHILYWTAWVDDRGTVQFRKDIYGRDEPLLAALREKPPQLPGSHAADVHVDERRARVEADAPSPHLHGGSPEQDGLATR